MKEVSNTCGLPPVHERYLAHLIKKLFIITYGDLQFNLTNSNKPFPSQKPD